METSIPLPVVQTVSLASPTANASSVQAGTIPFALAPQVPQVPAAVPLQQLDLQRSLLMQQYALSQQTMNIAAKSPAEIAAARAAEISKQLEESGAVADKDSLKRSKSRSKTKSPSYSHSPSKSRSRSPALSPIKRRRRHSRSLSPIRNRRDHYSSYGSRDYYGYRGYKYRRYFRGSYNDHFRYRYDHDHGYHYGRQRRSRERRRSRTRSPRRDRSRGRRRSPTLSPPVLKRSDTGSSEDLKKQSPPLPAGNEDISRSQHTSQQSLSGGTMESPSASGGSVDASAARSNSRSESHEKFLGDQKVDDYHQTEPREDMDKKQIASNLKMPEGPNGTQEGGAESSSSPARSLSVLFDNNKCASTSNEVNSRRRRELSAGDSSENHDNAKNSTGKMFVPKAQEYRLRQNHLGHERGSRTLTQGSHSISQNDGQSCELMDGWQERLKKIVKAKDIFAEEEEDNILAGRLETKSSDFGSIKRGHYYATNANICDQQEETEVHKSRIIADEDSVTIMEELHCLSNQDNKSVMVDDNTKQNSTLVDVKETSYGRDNSQPSNVEDLVFEGPQPAIAVCDERMRIFQKATNFDAQFRDANARIVHSPISCERGAEICNTSGHSDGPLHYINNKVCNAEDKDRDKSRSGDSKKHETGLTKLDRHHRSKHRRHRKRHKNESTDEDPERPKKRHRRKHRRESKHNRREWNERRHKHKSRSSFAEPSSSADGAKAERTIGKKRKKSSKRHGTSKKDLSESSTSSFFLA